MFLDFTQLHLDDEDEFVDSAANITAEAAKKEKEGEMTHPLILDVAHLLYHRCPGRQTKEAASGRASVTFCCDILWSSIASERRLPR